MEIFVYITKLIVYGLLISLSGLIMVDSFVRNAIAETRIQWRESIIQTVNRSLLLAVILAIFAQVVQWTQSFGGVEQIATLLIEGSTGRTWLALLLLSAIGLFVQKLQAARLIIIVLLLLAESMNGHASSDSLIILFDFIHLATISIWVGGVIYFLVNWKDGTEQVRTFLERFTKLLWLTIAIASVSGIALTALILPSISYLLYTSWGQLLLVKIVAILIAIWLGYTANTYIRKHQADRKSRLLKIEYMTLLVVIALAALLSTISPLPSAENALNRHQMGDELHYTVKLSPNAPGPNTFSLSLWTLKEEGEVANVQLSLYADDKPKTSARAYILQSIPIEDNIEFPGFIEQQFSLKELKLPYPTLWHATVDIVFASGQERQFSFSFEN
ncbi:copper resistance D family protein [Paenibacillus camelliae]|uniref:copper resistance D family protein n=1 Tax=Paenibacillus camelliae TaxID=512410 RepID=UPI00203F8AD8|nr:CopD family protein [Paenibacillus camelliae]MCM3632560.1 CopD family protein [Paenibacillus camelliae]